MTSLESAGILDMDDDDLVSLDGSGLVIPIAVGVIVEKPSAKELVAKTSVSEPSISPQISAHDDGAWKTWIKSVGVLLFECRLMEGFEDLALIRDIRRARPMLPIIVVSENIDPDYVLEAYKAGANDYVASTTPEGILATKVLSFNRLSESARLIEVQNDELVGSMKAQRDADERRLKAEAEKSVAQAQAEAHKQTREILDNLTEGFFVIEKNLSIGSGTSKSCDVMFGPDIAGKPLGAVLNLEGDTEKYLVVGILQVFENFMPVDVTIGLLPTRVVTQTGKNLEIRYKVIPDAAGDPARLIVGALDITDSLKEKRVLELENTLNRALVEILKDKASFVDFVADFRRDVASLKSTTDIATANRVMHTLKGNSAAFSLTEIAEFIHGAEHHVKGVENESEAIALAQKYALEIELQFEAFLTRHQGVLMLASDALEGETYTISNGALSELNRLADGIDHKTALRIRSITRITKLKPVGGLISQFKPTVERLSIRNSKAIKLDVVGGDLRIDSPRFMPLLRSLIHSVRNSCDHGIEIPEERSNLGKPETGTIKFGFSSIDDRVFRITITDDGRGLDRERILAKAISKNLITPEAAADASTRDWVALIFKAGFSTAAEVTDVSGRGVGMDCIRAEVEKLGGTISIGTAAGVGTKLVIEVPF